MSDQESRREFERYQEWQQEQDEFEEQSYVHYLEGRIEELEGAFVRGNATQTHINLYSLIPEPQKGKSDG